MSRADELRERPPSGEYEWPNNGEIHERMRADLLARAEEAEAAGEVSLGEELRARADRERRERNRCFREHERRMLNRSLAWRRRYF